VVTNSAFLFVVVFLALDLDGIAGSHQHYEVHCKHHWHHHVEPHVSAVPVHDWMPGDQQQPHISREKGDFNKKSTVLYVRHPKEEPSMGAQRVGACR
jgi:hypothetical protein